MAGIQIHVVAATKFIFGEFIGFCVESWFIRLNSAITRFSFAISAPIDALENSEQQGSQVTFNVNNNFPATLSCYIAQAD